MAKFQVLMNLWQIYLGYSMIKHRVEFTIVEDIDKEIEEYPENPRIDYIMNNKEEALVEYRKSLEEGLKQEFELGNTIWLEDISITTL